MLMMVHMQARLSFGALLVVGIYLHTKEWCRCGMCVCSVQCAVPAGVGGWGGYLDYLTHNAHIVVKTHDIQSDLHTHTHVRTHTAHPYSSQVI